MIFLSSLTSDCITGGAYLRNSSILQIYRTLGLNSQIIYVDQIQEGLSIDTAINCLRYGLDNRRFFKKIVMDLPQSEFYHFDGLKFFGLHGEKVKQSFLIYNAHNLEFENCYGSLNSFKAKKLARYEIDKILSSNLTFVCSEREKQVLENLEPTSGERVMVLPNLIDFKQYKKKPNKNVILFLGTLDYYPNIEAVKFLCQEISPQITSNFKSNFDFVIAGKNPSAEVRRAVSESIFRPLYNLSGEDLKDLLASTLLLLVPLKNGSGTRLKIIEAIASGALILSTAKGSEGIISSEMVHVCSIENFKRSLFDFLNSELFQNSFDHDFLIKKYETCYDINFWTSLHMEELKFKMGLKS